MMSGKPLANLQSLFTKAFPRVALIMQQLCLLPVFFCLVACSPPIMRGSVKKPIVSEIVPPAKLLPTKPLPQQPIAVADPLHPLRFTPLIVIDAGHGGNDFGTYSVVAPKYKEKLLNLTTASMLKEYLQKMGYRTLMTRFDDHFVSLEDRSEFANGSNAKLFVSIHYNSAPNKEAEGIEVFYYRSDTDKTRSADSKQLAQAVIKQVTKHTDAKSRGVKHGNLAVIRETKMPAILLEGGFLTNANEIQKIKDTSYQKRLAWGIAQGIHEYLTKTSNAQKTVKH